MEIKYGRGKDTFDFEKLFTFISSIKKAKNTPKQIRPGYFYLTVFCIASEAPLDILSILLIIKNAGILQGKNNLEIFNAIFEF